MIIQKEKIERAPGPLKLGFEVLKEVPPILRPLADAIVACYRRHHPDLLAVYVIGSVAVGEWTEGVSDIDVVGVVKGGLNSEAETARRNELLELGRLWPQVSLIDNSILSLVALRAKNPDPMVVGRAQIISVTGLHIDGANLDFSDYFPTVEEMAYGRAVRAKILMERYRKGIVNEPFRTNPRLLTRSCAKAALRVLSGITILRGAIFYTSPKQTYEMVVEYVPEAIPLAQRAFAIVNGAECEPPDAMEITEQAIALFYDLYPDN
jgi:predicted nucleotidyltransferase